MSKRKEEPSVEVEGATILEDSADMPQAEEGVEYTDPAADSVGDTTAEDDTPETTERDRETRPAPSADDDVPTHLKGKSAEEIAREYTLLHRRLGEQGRELGELRRLADEHLRLSIEEKRQRAAERQPKQDPVKPVEDKDFFENPKAAIERAIEQHPEVQRLRRTEQEAKAEIVAQKMQRAKEAFERAHPDAGTILADPNFRQWIQGSQVRQRLLLAADRNYDFAAGHEIFSTWKELQGARAPKVEADKAAANAKRTAAKSAAKVPTGGNAAPAKSSGNSAEGKIYRRADLIKLQMNDPDRYEAMGAEIEKAYREGRVR